MDENGGSFLVEYCRQTWVRIRLSLAAYTYEFESREIMSDSDFDKMCLEVDPSIPTGNKTLDKFFRESFDPSTGVWIWEHPEKHKIKYLVDKYYPS